MTRPTLVNKTAQTREDGLFGGMKAYRLEDEHQRPRKQLLCASMVAESASSGQRRHCHSSFHFPSPVLQIRQLVPDSKERPLHWSKTEMINCAPKSLIAPEMIILRAKITENCAYHKMINCAPKSPRIARKMISLVEWMGSNANFQWNALAQMRIFVWMGSNESFQWKMHWLRCEYSYHEYLDLVARFRIQYSAAIESS